MLPTSLDTLINPDVSPVDEGSNPMKMLYCSCSSEMRETLSHHTQETAKELTELSEKFDCFLTGSFHFQVKMGKQCAKIDLASFGVIDDIGL